MRDLPVGMKSSWKTWQYKNVVIYISFPLSDAETNYHTIEKEILAVLQYLEETQWLVKGSDHPVILYTNY